MNFIDFKNAVAKQFDLMCKQPELFRTTASKDDMWDTYLASFPEGTNPIYRERTEYDCNCCKNFIRKVGNVIAIIDGRPVSIWDFTTDIEMDSSGTYCFGVGLRRNGAGSRIRLPLHRGRAPDVGERRSAARIGWTATPGL